MVKWTRRWKPIWVPCGNCFQKPYVEGWEQEVHTSDVNVDIAGKTPVLVLGATNYLTKKCSLLSLARILVTIAKVCVNPIVRRSRWTPTTSPMAHRNLWMTEGIHLVIHHLYHLVYVPRRNRRGNRNASKCSWVFNRNEKQPNELTGGMPLVIEPLDEPGPSEPNVPEVINPVQHGIAPKRLLLRHSDAKILSAIDEDISS